ncbi:MAG TPA: DUF4184 family protein [Chryseolinea sp.]|nr:DUF4184 family protein [Chryseolinea sp.]
MPFTPAHPAIILPFIRSRYFSATGLIAGSMSPDFEYFFKMSVSSVYSHTVAGLFYFDLPVTILIALVFHLIVKKNLIYNLPLFLQKKFQALLEFDFVKYLKEHVWIFVISGLLGAASHILWDSFTHNNSFFAQTLPVYKSVHVPFDGVRYPLFYALQHISTAVGLTVVLIYILSMRSWPVHSYSKQKFLYWFTLASIAMVITWVRFLIRPLGTDIGNLIVSIISGLLLAFVCCGLINFKRTNIAEESRNG